MCNMRLLEIESVEQEFLVRHLDFSASQADQLARSLTVQAQRLKVRMDGRYEVEDIREALSANLKERANDLRRLNNLSMIEAHVVTSVYRRFSHDTESASPLTGSTHAADIRTMERFARKN